MNLNIEAESSNGSEPVSPLVVEKEIIEHISEISKNSRTTFFALIIACVYSYLAISTTSDAALLTNSGATPLPIIQVKVPIVWFYYFAPIILTVLFFYFHFYLERFWRSIVRLPLYHLGDRRELDNYVYPWLISSTFIRGGNPKLARKRSLSRLEYGLSLLLGWWLIPLILLFYWARYLVAHEWGGTMLHSALLLMTVGFAFRFYYLAKNAVTAIPDNSQSDNVKPPSEKQALRYKPVQIVTGVVSTLVLGGMIGYLSTSAIYGLPADKCREMDGDDTCHLFVPGTLLLSWIGVEPFADVREKKLVAKPENWQDLLDKPNALRRYLETQTNLKLSDRNLRHLNAQRAFLPASFLERIIFDYADFEHAVLTRSKLSNVSFRGANLTHADFQHARITSTKFIDVDADVSRFNHVRFITGENENRTLFSGEYYDAWFDHSYGDNLQFSDANLRESHFKKAKIGFSNFDNVDLAGAKFEDAEFLNNKFYQTDFSNAQIQAADLSYSAFKECKFFSTVIIGATFEDAELINSQFDFSVAISTGSVSDQGGSQTDKPRNVLDSFYGFGVKFKNSQIHNTDFTNADLRFARFEAVSFQNARFSNTDLSGATFVDTNLSGVEFDNVDFSGADLKNVSGLTETHMQNICGNRETKIPQGFGEIKPCIQ
jgi:uncharacterized protein YjbI with pentapeptide repeats